MTEARMPVSSNAMLENNFAYHAPKTSGVVEAHQSVRSLCLDLAKSFDTLLPSSREKALAFTKLEEAMMWANAAIARNQ